MEDWKIKRKERIEKEISKLKKQGIISKNVTYNDVEFDEGDPFLDGRFIMLNVVTLFDCGRY